jgi:hypothetical protein
MNRILPSFPHIPVVTIALAPMIIPSALASTPTVTRGPGIGRWSNKPGIGSQRQATEHRPRGGTRSACSKGHRSPHSPCVSDPISGSFRENQDMLRKTMLGVLVCVSVLTAVMAGGASQAKAAGVGQPYDWGRYYYYPYVYYPHNFHAPVQFDNMYYRYPQERQIPVYNTGWYNPYIEPKPYHKGHHFILDVF